MSDSKHDCSEFSKQGLYDPRFEHDACGIGFVAQVSGERSHLILEMALTALSNVAHRGGISADGKSGDGAGVLTQLPLPLISRELAKLGVAAPADSVAVGMIFLPQDPMQQARARRLVEDGLAHFGLQTLGWRTVPVDITALGARARESCPAIEQVFVARGDHSAISFERLLYLSRKQIEAG